MSYEPVAGTAAGSRAVQSEDRCDVPQVGVAFTWPVSGERHTPDLVRCDLRA